MYIYIYGRVSFQKKTSGGRGRFSQCTSGALVLEISCTMFTNSRSQAPLTTNMAHMKTNMFTINPFQLTLNYYTRLHPCATSVFTADFLSPICFFSR